MNGCIIPGTSIAVDFWQVNKSPGIKFFFLTHLHGDHVVGLTSTWRFPLYCSPLTAQLLEERYGVSRSILRPLEVGQSHLVGYCEKHCAHTHGQVSDSGRDRLLEREKKGGSCTTMTVTVIHANHCPGAVMFLFEGHFGKILHTGDFRFQPDMIEEGSLLYSHIGTIDKLYLDNTYCDPKCVFPTREEVLDEIIQICKKHGKHDVVLMIRSLGKEELLAAVALGLGEYINVSPNTFSVVSALKFPNVFTTDQPEARLRVMYKHWVSCKVVTNVNRQKPTIFIHPTALLQGIEGKPYANQPEVFVVPYSDHSSFPELMKFVSKLKPACVVPIVHNKTRGPFGVDISRREDMSYFKDFLSKAQSTVLPPVPYNTQTQKHSCLSAEINEFAVLFPDFHVKKRKRSMHGKKHKVLLPKGVIYLSGSDDDVAGGNIEKTAAVQGSVTPNSAENKPEQTVDNIVEMTNCADVTLPYFRDDERQLHGLESVSDKSDTCEQYAKETESSPHNGLEDIPDRLSDKHEQCAKEAELSPDNGLKDIPDKLSDKHEQYAEEAESSPHNGLEDIPDSLSDKHEQCGKEAELSPHNTGCAQIENSVSHNVNSVSGQHETGAANGVLCNKADISHVTAKSPSQILDTQISRHMKISSTVQVCQTAISRRFSRSTSGSQCRAKLIHIYNIVFDKKKKD